MYLKCRFRIAVVPWAYRRCIPGESNGSSCLPCWTMRLRSSVRECCRSSGGICLRAERSRLCLGNNFSCLTYLAGRFVHAKVIMLLWSRFDRDVCGVKNNIIADIRRINCQVHFVGVKYTPFYNIVINWHKM